MHALVEVNPERIRQQQILRGSMTTPQKNEIIVFMYSVSPTLALHKMFFIFKY